MTKLGTMIKCTLAAGALTVEEIVEALSNLGWSMDDNTPYHQAHEIFQALLDNDIDLVKICALVMPKLYGLELIIYDHDKLKTYEKDGSPVTLIDICTAAWQAGYPPNLINAALEEGQRRRLLNWSLTGDEIRRRLGETTA